MHIIKRRPHDGSGSIIQIDDGLITIEVEILEVIGQEVIIGIVAPGDMTVQRKEARHERLQPETPLTNG